jgi:hypothetical protein
MLALDANPGDPGANQARTDHGIVFGDEHGLLVVAN